MSKGKNSRSVTLKLQPNTKVAMEAKSLSPNEVVTNLIGLFNEIGLDSNILQLAATNSTRTKKALPPLYPRHAEIGELLTAWHQDPKYLDHSGNPLPIRRSGRRPSFAELSKKISPSLRPAMLLKHLEQIGAVEIDAEKRIRVQMRSIPVYLDRSLAIEYTLNTLNGFIKTLRHNINSTPLNSDQLFHRIASSAQFELAEIPALKVRIKRYGQNFLESCDNWMTRKCNARAKSSAKRKKVTQVTVGVYLAVDGLNR